jgi:hypothetical protein
MTQIPIRITDFRGGENKVSPERLSPVESSIIQNLYHVEGGLTSIEGRNLYNQTEILANTPVRNVYRWYRSGHRVNDVAATTTQGWTLARCGEYVWIACEVATSATGGLGDGYITVSTDAAKLMPSAGTLLVTEASDGNGYYQLAYTAKDESTGRLTCTVPENWTDTVVRMVDFRPILKTTGRSNKVDFEPMNNRLYIAAYNLYRFDGFYYAVGTAACTGNATVTGTNTLWAAGVRPGDKVFFKVNGSWGNQYTVSAVGSDTSITLTGNGPNTSGTVDYIIARTFGAGIPYPPYQPTLTAKSATPGALGVGDYKYKYTFRIGSIWTGFHETLTASPEATITTTGPDSTDKVTLTIPCPKADWGGIESVIIYRTEAGGSTFKQCAIIQTFGGNNPPNTDDIVYIDGLADGSLGIAFDDRTDTSDSSRISPPTIAPTLELIDGGISPLDEGTYNYCYTLYDSATNTESNPSPTKEVTVGASQYSEVVISTTGCDRQADYIKVYRTAAGGTLYKELTTLEWTAGATSITLEDNIPDGRLGAILRYDHEDAPENIWFLRVFNGRMYAWGGDESLYFSTVGDPEHWPRYEYGVIEPTFTDPTLGGFVRVAHEGDTIKACIPDAGAYASTGTTGANMLVMTTSRTFLWWGRTWVDHRLDEAFGEGCISGHSVANCGGTLLWMTTNGPMAKPIGSAFPERVYTKLFPPVLRPYAGQTTSGYMSYCTGAYWREYYIFSWASNPATVPDKTAMLHLPTRTFSEIGTTTAPCKAYDFSVWNGPGDDGELYYGDSEKGYVWRLFAKTGTKTYWTPSTQTGVNCVHRSPLIITSAKTEDVWGNKHAGRLEFCFNTPVVTQSITPKIFTNGEQATPTSLTAQTLTGSGNANVGRRSFVKIPPESLSADARAFQIEWEGTFTDQITLQGLIFTFDQTGR